MSKPWTLFFLSAAALLILGASVVGGPAAAVLFAVLAVAFPPALMRVGAGRRGKTGRAAAPILALLLLLELALAAMFLLRGAGADAPLVLGLPAAAAVQIVGFFVAPLVVVALGYAWAFDDSAPTPEDLSRLRELAAAEGDE